MARKEMFLAIFVDFEINRGRKERETKEENEQGKRGKAQ